MQELLYQMEGSLMSDFKLVNTHTHKPKNKYVVFVGVERVETIGFRRLMVNKISNNILY